MVIFIYFTGYPCELTFEVKLHTSIPQVDVWRFVALGKSTSKALEIALMVCGFGCTCPERTSLGLCYTFKY